MSGTDINLLGPSQNPQDPGPLLAPTEQAETPDQERMRLVGRHIDEIARREEEAENQNLLSVLRMSSVHDPVLRAEANQIGLDLNVGADLVEADMEGARRIMKFRKHNAFVQAGGNPTLMKALLDPNFAAIAHDDIDNLSTIELLTKGFEVGDVHAQIDGLNHKTMMAGGEWEKEDMIELASLKERLRNLPEGGRPADSFFSGLVFDNSKMVGGMFDTMWKATAIGAVSAAVVTVFGRSNPVTGFIPLPYEVATGPLAFGAGMTYGVGIGSGRQIAGANYAEMIELGIPHDIAKNKAEWAGVYGGIMETVAFRLFGGRIALKALTRTLGMNAGKDMLGEITKRRVMAQFLKETGKGYIGEVGTEVGQEISRWMLLNEAFEESGVEGEAELNIKETIIETLRGVAIIGAFGPARNSITNLRQANEAVAGEARLLEMDTVISESKVKGRSQDQFMDFLEQSSDGEKVLSFDLKEFLTAMEEAELTMADLEKLAPEIAEIVKSAQTESLGDFEIPTHTFGAKFMGKTKFGRAMIPHARSEAGGMSAVEGVLYQQKVEQLTKEGIDLLASEEKVSKEFREGVLKIRKAKLAEMLKAGVEPNKAAESAAIYGHFVAVTAHELGMTPEAFQKKHNAKVIHERDAEAKAEEALDEASAVYSRLVSESLELKERVGDASKAYDEAVNKHGEDSPEAQAAMVAAEEAREDVKDKDREAGDYQRAQIGDPVIDQLITEGRPLRARARAAKKAFLEAVDKHGENSPEAKAAKDAYDEAIRARRKKEREVDDYYRKSKEEALDPAEEALAAAIRVRREALSEALTLKKRAGDARKAYDKAVDKHGEDSPEAKAAREASEEAREDFKDKDREVDNAARAQIGDPALDQLIAEERDLRGRARTASKAADEAIDKHGEDSPEAKAAGEAYDEALKARRKKEREVEDYYKEAKKAAKEAAEQPGILEQSALAPTVPAKLTKAQSTKLKELKAAVPGLGAVLRWLQPDELVNLTMEGRKGIAEARARELVELLKRMPKADEMVAVALAGRSKRGWYLRSTKAITDIFGEDAPRFAATLAALSPQTSVEANLSNTLSVWGAWVRAGRPTDRKSIIRIMGENVQGSGTEASVLNAWKNNTVTALTAVNPEMIVLSGPKVQSFTLNLRGFVNEVTNDAWMANFAFVEQELFGNDRTVSRPGKGPGYLAMSIAARRAAAKMDWTGAEVQETVWSFTKALYEGAYGSSTGGSGAGVTAEVFLTEGMLKHDDINATPDFDVLFREAEFAAILKSAGYGARLSVLGAVPASTASGTVYDAKAKDAPLLKRVAKRLDKLAKKRAFDKSRAEVLVNLSAATNTIPGIRALHEKAEQGDLEAARALRDIAADMLRYLTATIKSAEVTMTEATGFYAGAFEPSMGLSISFQERDRVKMLRALKQFAINFNQQQVHVRGDASGRLGKDYGDGSYNTPSYRLKLAKPLSREDVTRVTEASGLKGLTFTNDYVEVYFVGDPTNAQAITEFRDAVRRAAKSVGANGRSVEAGLSRLWAYGDGPGASIGYEEIDGQFRAPTKDDEANRTSARVASRLAGRTVEGVEQAAKITKAQAAQQRRIADAYEAMALDNLNDAQVRRAYKALAAELMSQFEALPIKVEIYDKKGEPYGGKNMSAKMRRDVNANNHLFIFATNPEQFGPSGVTYDQHPLLDDSGLTDSNGKPLLVNDLLRAVHDYYAHTMTTAGFGPLGEEAAWSTHMAMTSNPWARWALTSETRGQNSWVNFRKEVEGKPLSERGFATQKVDLMPLEFSMTGNPSVDASLAELPGSDGLNLEPVALNQNERGRYIPKDQEIQLTDTSDASTLLHEMVHHFTNVLLNIASEGNAPQSILDKVDTMMRFWKIEGETPEARLAKWNSMSFKEQAPHQESLSYNYELWLFTGKAPTLGMQRLFSRIRTFMLGVYTSLTEIQRRLTGNYKAEFGVDLPSMTPELQDMFARMLAGETAAAHAETVRQMAPLFAVKADFIAMGNTEQEWEELQQKLDDARQRLITDLSVDSMQAMKWLERAKGKVVSAMKREHKENRKAVKEEITERVNAMPIYRVIESLKQDGAGLDLDAVLAVLGDLDAEALASVRQKLRGLLKARTKVPKPKPAPKDVADRKRSEALKRWQEKVRESHPDTYRTSFGPVFREKVDGKMVNMSWDQVQMTIDHLAPAVARVEEILTAPDEFILNGHDPDVVADAYPEAFKDGKALVSALIAARPVPKEIEAQTDAEMLRLYGPPMDPEAIRDRTERAVHSDARARFAAAEMKFLTKSTKPSRVLLAAAKEAARVILLDRQLNDMDPHKFTQLETRANAAAHTAMKPVAPRKASTDKNGKVTEAVEGRGPDLQAAIEFKRRALLYNQLAKQALAIKADVAKVQITLFKQVARGKAKKVAGSKDPDYVMAARTILAQYGLIPDAALAETADYMQRMATYLPGKLEGFSEALGAAQAAGQAVDFKWQRMTLDEFNVMREAVASLWFLAKNEHSMMVEGQRVELEHILDEMSPAMINALKKDKDGNPIAPQVSSLKSTPWGNFWSKSKVALTKIEHWAYQMDGGKQGAITKYLYRNVKEAIDAYRKSATINVKNYVEMLDELRRNKLMPTQKIEWVDPDTKKVIHIFGGEGSKQGGISELLGALLHMGNESNRSKFLVAGRFGKSWATEHVDAAGKVTYTYEKWEAFELKMIEDGHLTEAHYQFAQNVWDLMDSIKPKLQEAHMKLEGYSFKEVKPAAFTRMLKDKNGKSRPVNFRGGYVPAGVDYEAAKVEGIIGPTDMTEAQLKGEFFEGLPQVGGGMTMERADGYRKRPLTMDLASIGAHIDKSLRYAHVAPAIADMHKIVSSDRFTRALAKIDPHAKDELLIPFMRRAVTQTLYTSSNVPGMNAVAPFFKYMRRMTGVSIMAFNVVNSAQQLTGLSNANLYVDATYMKSALALYISNPRRLAREVALMSDFMSDRMNNQMFGLTDDMKVLVQADIGKGQSVQTWSVSKAYTLQAMMQNIVDTITWQGAYEQGMANAPEGESLEAMELRSTREADAAVRMSQGSFSPEDVAGYEEGSAMWRAFTQFTSYFSTILNQLAYSPKEHSLMQKLHTKLMAFTIPMLLAEAISMTFYGKWDDEDDDGYVDDAVWANLLLGSQIRGGLAMAPYIGPSLVNLYEMGINDRAYGDRVVSSPAQATVMRALQGLMQMGRTIADEDKALSGRTLRDTITAGVLFLPYGGAAAAPFAKPIAWTTGVVTGKTEPTGFWDTVRGFVTGYASEESRK